MQFDMFTVIMGLLMGSFLTLFLHFLSRKVLFLRTFGIGAVLFLYLLCVLRMLLPVKFPFTITVGVPAWDGLAAMLNAPIFDTGWNFGRLLTAVWLTGAAVSLLVFAAREIRLARRLRRHPGMRHPLAEAVLDSIRQSSRRRLPVGVRVYRGLDMPVGVGLLRPLICLPDRDYTAKELSYILRHEYAHFLGRDLYVKLLARVYAGLFWWDPAAWLLLGDIGRVLELRCDRRVTKDFTVAERREYLTVILRSIAQVSQSTALPWVNTPLFASSARAEMLERFRLVACPEKASGRQGAVMTAGSALLFAGSYAFLFQPPSAASRFILPEGMAESLLLLAAGMGAAVWAWRRYKRAVRPYQRRIGALVTAAAVLVTGLGVYQTGFQAGLSHAPVTAVVTSWDGRQNKQIAIDTEHFDGLTSLDVHDVMYTSDAIGANPDGPYKWYYCDGCQGRLRDADTRITAANCFEAVSAVPADSVEYGPGVGPEFLTDNAALCGISDHYARLTGLQIGDQVTLRIYTLNFYFYGAAYQYVGWKTLRIAAVYPYDQGDGSSTPDMTVPAGWLRAAVEEAGADFCYSSLSAKLDDPWQAYKVWDMGFVPSGTGDKPYRYNNTVTMLT